MSISRQAPGKPSDSAFLEEEAVIVAFRRHTLPRRCLYALQPTIPHLTRSSLHRCLQRHGISRLPEVEGSKPSKKKFKAYPIGYFHIDLAEVQTAEGKLYLYVAIDRTSKFAFVQLVKKTGPPPPPRSSDRGCPKDSEGPHALRIHLQMLDFPARTNSNLIRSSKCRD